MATDLGKPDIVSFLKESPTESEQIDLDKFKNSLNAVALTAFYQCHLLTDLE